MSVIEDILDKITISFISKKAQMYTLFCVVFKMFDKKPFDDFFEKIKIFVTAYSKFRNEFALDYEDDVMSAVYADIKNINLPLRRELIKLLIGQLDLKFCIKYVQNMEMRYLRR